MVRHEDRALLARVARMNEELAATALPLADGTLDAHQLRELGAELVAIGHEYLRRGEPALTGEAMASVVDGSIATGTSEPPGALDD